MPLKFDPADYEREPKSRRAKKEIDYFVVNSSGFNDPEDGFAEVAPGRKRKGNEEEERPAAKRAKMTGAVKASSAKKTAPAKATSAKKAVSKSKGKTNKETPSSKAKTATTAKKGKQAPTKSSKARTTKSSSRKKATPKNNPRSTPATSKKAVKAKSGAARGKTKEPLDEQSSSNEIHLTSHGSEEQTYVSSDLATLRENAHECQQPTDRPELRKPRAHASASASHQLQGASMNWTPSSSTPFRQFYFATSLGPGFTVADMDAVSDTSSELSDVPDDLDMSIPELTLSAPKRQAQEELSTRNSTLASENTSSNGQEESSPGGMNDEGGEEPFNPTADDASSLIQQPAQTISIPAEPSKAMSAPRYKPLSSLRGPRRVSKQVQRYGNLIATTTAVDEHDVVTSSDAEMPEEIQFEEQDASAEEDLEDSPPATKKKPARAASRPRPQAPKTPKTPVTNSRKRKQSNDTTSSSKRRKPLIAKLPVSGDFVTPRAKVLTDGLLTPPDSQPELDLSLIDPERMKLYELSQKLTTRQPIESKPLPQGQPLVWADSRQALCETTPYFKMHNSGCHSNDGHVYSFLFDAAGSTREYMDSDVIISRAGGGMEPDPKTGTVLQKQDHSMNESQVQSVLNDTALQNPLIIISGDRHQGAICKMPHRYNVLGWYKPVAVWGEKVVGKGGKVFTTIKYRFERLDQTKPAWHAPGDSFIGDEDRELAGALLRKTCDGCQKESPQAYLLGWMCLNPDCEEFWQRNGRDAPYGNIAYNPAFLFDRTTWPVEEQPYSVKPPIPDVGNFVGDNLTQINTRGICCPDCGRCSSRRLFKGWQCDNPRCTYQNFPKHIPVKVPMLHTPMDNCGDGPALARNKHLDGVNVQVSYLHDFKAYKYTVPGVNGSFTHLVSNSKINREPGGADEMFLAIQDQSDPEMDLHLERRRFGGEKMSGSKVDEKKAKPGRPSKSTKAPISPVTPSGPEQSSDTSRLDTIQQNDTPPANETSPALIPPQQTAADESIQAIQDGDFMTAFAMNYGMPYKFVASGASLPFTAAPWPVRAVRADLNWASQTFLDPAHHVEFNEELIFAYLEGQKIEYHDDGEEGLGPRIATMSLGGKAKMMLRIKQKHYTGCSKSGILTPERPIPGGFKHDELYEKRLTAWEELQDLKNTDKTLYEQRRKQFPHDLGLFPGRHKTAPDLVTVTLNHGDIVLMEGYEIQQYLEHKVLPEQCLRFALTCRVVLPEHLKEEEKPGYEVEADEEGMSALRGMAAREEEGGDREA